MLTALLLGLALSSGAAPVDHSLQAPEKGSISVAFLISKNAQVIDWAGPWEVFQDVMISGRGSSHHDAHPFRLFTVAESRDPIRATGGLQVVPDYTFADAPQPQVIVVPAQGGVTPALLEWLRAASVNADLTMSVCTGAFILGKAGLLDGREATTHHAFFDRFERTFPQARLNREVRWVEGPGIATAAGLTSGIDLALRVVERYFGTEAADQAAQYMEHQSDGWRPEKGRWAEVVAASAATPRPPRAVLKGLDPVHLTRGRKLPGDSALAETHEGNRYHFVDQATRAEFRSDPDRYSIQLKAACATMATNGAEAGSGDVDRFLVHDGRIYVFAGEHCQREFQADPDRYLGSARGQLQESEYPGDDTHPVFSPDGSRVAYISNREGVAEGRPINFEIYVVDLATRQERRLTFDDAFEADLAWSPDGSRIAFKSYRDGNDEVYLMAADGSRQINLTRHPGSDGGPSFMPGGEHLIFSSDRDGNKELYRMRADGSAVERLTTHPATDNSPSVSPDGSRVAFVSDRDGNDEVYVMKLGDGETTRVTRAPLADWSPIWTPDGDGLVVTYGDWETDRWDLVQVSLDGTRREVLFEGSDSGNASWRLQDGVLAFGAPVVVGNTATASARIHLAVPGAAGLRQLTGRVAGSLGH